MLKKKGFTLVEVLVVLAVLGALIAIILPNASSAIASSQRREYEGTARSLNAALVACVADNNNVWTACNTVAGITGGNPNGISYVDFAAAQWPNRPNNPGLISPITGLAIAGNVPYAFVARGDGTSFVH